MTKWVYSFGNGTAEGRADMRDVLGGKGANLAEMSNLGLPVPPGFTISTEVCTTYYENNHQYPESLESDVRAALQSVEEIVGSKFGDAHNPLLVSVRSGARASMPGMMDTVLNLGLTDVTVQGLAQQANDKRFAYDSYRRFIQMYSNVVLDLDHHDFEEIIDEIKDSKGITLDTEMSADDWKEVVEKFKALVEQELGKPFPQDPLVQLWGAIGAVFGSWMNQRAITYRRLHGIPASWGTAVNVQSMVFGNMGEDCCTGVAFTRDPNTGEKVFFGEYLINAQGEDVVAGIRTPNQINIEGRKRQEQREDGYGSSELSMEEAMPQAYNHLVEIYNKLENHYRDMQDIEFTVQKNKLYMLQTRSGKRTGPAALKIAVDMCREGLITKEEAIRRVDPSALDQLLHPTIDPKAKLDIVVRGLPASPGAACGAVVFSADDAEREANHGRDVILVRIETSPEDIHGMHAAKGILTSRGGMTSHAAVVARGMGTPCVSGAGSLKIDYHNHVMTIGDVMIRQGDVITLDGATGEVMVGEVPMVQPNLSGDFADLMEWADSVRRLKIRTNAETPRDAETARQFGAEGIGLCRTEHMFFDVERINVVRNMILAEDQAGRRAALDQLLPFQRADFSELFTIMAGLPVTVRLLDPPLHEFLPHTDEEIEDVSKALDIDDSQLRHRLSQLKEFNPMLGHRGCRLGITYPEIYEMQARAIFEGAVAVSKAGIDTVVPEIMIPLIATKVELDTLKKLVDKTAAAVFEETGVKLDYMVGTMIELPRAALQARSIAESAEFFSFGTNDLTQTTFGISRDDSARFLQEYQRLGLLDVDPFISLDQEGVGELVTMASERGRMTKPDIKLGICGEHGGDPASIRFCHKQGLDYVSCSPYRVPIARLAAAQAALS